MVIKLVSEVQSIFCNIFVSAELCLKAISICHIFAENRAGELSFQKCECSLQDFYLIPWRKRGMSARDADSKESETFRSTNKSRDIEYHKRY
jgi:hypothetical protein